MQNLLEITVVPAKYELEISRARLEYEQNLQPRANVQTTYAQVQMKSEAAAVRIDTYEARRSLGIERSGDFMRRQGQRGHDLILQGMGQAVVDGNRKADIHEGVTIAQLAMQKMMEQPETFTFFLPSGGADISWQPHSLDIEVMPGEINYDWQTEGNVLNYVPGSVRLKMLQYPSVNIQYMGGPMYIPKSADPNYQPPATA